jgi:hypothetical protein
MRALAVAALALLVSGSAGATIRPDRLALLAQYEPVLLFDRAEDWAPQSVDGYLKLARVEGQAADGTLRLDLPCKLRSGYACYHREALADTNWEKPVVYATVVPVPASTPPPPGQTQRPSLLLHYWLFYAFDDWRSAHQRLWQTHEGDWESITIGLDANDTPLFAAYSEHCSGTVLPWQAVTKRAGTHPVAYVALGSHANWFTSSAAKTRFAECLTSGVGLVAKAKLATLIRLAQDQVVDRMGSAHPSGPAGLPGVTPMEVIPVDPATTPWARFPGRWGEGQIVWFGSTPRSETTISRGSAPGTPNWFAAKIGATWHPLSG